MYKIKLELFEKLVNAGLNLKSLKINPVIQQQKDKIVITDGSDLIIVPVETDQENFSMNITKDLKPIISFLKKQKVQEIEVNCETIRAGKIVFNHFNLQVNDEIPTKRDGDFKEIVGDKNIIFKMMQLLPFSSKDNQKYVLNGVAIKDGAIVATDGKRLSRFIFEDKNISFNIHVNTIKNIDLLFQNCNFYIDKDWMLVDDGIIQYYTNNNGVFPNWKQVIPTENKINYKYEVIGSDLFEKINLLKIKATKENPKSLTFVFQKDKVSITNSVGLVLDVAIKQEKESDDLELYADQNYFDFLKDKKEVKIEMVNRQNPIIFKDDTMLTVIMPMNK